MSGPFPSIDQLHGKPFGGILPDLAKIGHFQTLLDQGLPWPQAVIQADLSETDQQYLLAQGIVDAEADDDHEHTLPPRLESEATQTPGDDDAEGARQPGQRPSGDAHHPQASTSSPAHANGAANAPASAANPANPTNANAAANSNPPGGTQSAPVNLPSPTAAHSLPGSPPVPPTPSQLASGDPIANALFLGHAAAAGPANITATSAGNLAQPPGTPQIPTAATAPPTPPGHSQNQAIGQAPGREREHDGDAETAIRQPFWRLDASGANDRAANATAARTGEDGRATPMPADTRLATHREPTPDRATADRRDQDGRQASTLARHAAALATARSEGGDPRIAALISTPASAAATAGQLQADASASRPASVAQPGQANGQQQTPQAAARAADVATQPASARENANPPLAAQTPQTRQPGASPALPARAAAEIPQAMTPPTVAAMPANPHAIGPAAAQTSAAIAAIAQQPAGNPLASAAAPAGAPSDGRPHANPMSMQRPELHDNAHSRQAATGGLPPSATPGFLRRRTPGNDEGERLVAERMFWTTTICAYLALGCSVIAMLVGDHRRLLLDNGGAPTFSAYALAIAAIASVAALLIGRRLSSHDRRA